MLRKNPYQLVCNAYSQIPPNLSWKEGLEYGMKSLRWSIESSKQVDRLEANTLWVLHHQLKHGLLFQSDDKDDLCSLCGAPRSQLNKLYPTMNQKVISNDCK